MVDINRIGQALSGFGAGVAGRGQQFTQGMRDQKKTLSDERKSAMIEDAFMINQHLKTNRPDLAVNLLQNRIKDINSLNGDASDSVSSLQQLQSGDLSSVLADTQAVVDFANQKGFLDKDGGRTADQIRRQNLLNDLGSDDIDVSKSARIALGLDARAVTTPEELAERAKLVGKAKSDVAVEKERTLNSIRADNAKGIELRKGEAKRLTDFISQGMDAVGQMPSLVRGLELLKEVETGGLTAAGVVISDFFGTTDADVGELNNILGQRVLAGLSSFVGAISDSERKFVQDIETSLGSSTGVNKRLIKRGIDLLDRKIVRAKQAAKESGDDFALSVFANPDGQTLSGNQEDQSVIDAASAIIGAN